MKNLLKSLGLLKRSFWLFVRLHLFGIHELERLSKTALVVSWFFFPVRNFVRLVNSSREFSYEFYSDTVLIDGTLFSYQFFEAFKEIAVGEVKYFEITKAPDGVLRIAPHICRFGEAKEQMRLMAEFNKALIGL